MTLLKSKTNKKNFHEEIIVRSSKTINFEIIDSICFHEKIYKVIDQKNR